MKLLRRDRGLMLKCYVMVPVDGLIKLVYKDGIVYGRDVKLYYEKK